jgi:hypothetical protein
MGWAEQRARLLDGEPAATEEEPLPIPMPVQVRWAREKGWIEIRDPVDGSWHEIPYEHATPVWKVALRRKRDE